MELSSNGINIYVALVLILASTSSHVSSKSGSRVPICETTSVKTKCNSRSLTFLWTIKRRLGSDSAGLQARGPPSYFFGTIHVPYSQVWDSIPNRVKLAFQTSDRIIFELDLMDAYTVSTLANCQLLPDGHKLRDIIPNELYQRLRTHLDYVRLMLPNWLTSDQKARGLYADYLFNAITGNWERKRPVWVMLMVNSLNEFDIKSRGIPVLDLYLAQEAQRLNKKIGSIEKVEEQCSPLNGLDSSQVVFALNQTLRQHENIRRGRSRHRLTTDDLIHYYNCGDLNEMILNYDNSRFLNLKNEFLNSRSDRMAKSIDHYFRSELIIKRNERMSKRVLNILKANPNQSFFFAFGAGHFLGNNSILDFMKGSGFQVSRVSESWKSRGNRFSCRSRNIKLNTSTSLNTEESWQKLGLNHKEQFQLQNSRHKILSDSSAKDNDIYINRRPKQHLVLPSVKSTVDTHLWQTSDSLEDSRSRVITASSMAMIKNPRFNNLWVRLETVPNKDSLSIPHPMSKTISHSLHSSGASDVSLCLLCDRMSTELIVFTFVYISHYIIC